VHSFKGLQKHTASDGLKDGVWVAIHLLCCPQCLLFQTQNLVWENHEFDHYNVIFFYLIKNKKKMVTWLKWWNACLTR
jgi:hypothetical protein